LRATGTEVVDRQIELANAAFTAVCNESFPNATFWDWRYSAHAERGSGAGSRGEPLEQKRALIATLVEILDPTSVLDVGCGDGEATQGLPLEGYVGIDVSSEALKTARLGRPDGDYRQGFLTDHPVTAELTMCLDVLIHQADRSSYLDLVQALLTSSTRGLLVSGYDQPPGDSPSLHFHEPLAETLRGLAPDRELYELREVHGITTYLALQREAGDSDVESALLALQRPGRSRRSSRFRRR
jgi:SAM-dependent methyltransferase